MEDHGYVMSKTGIRHSSIRFKAAIEISMLTAVLLVIGIRVGDFPSASAYSLL